MSYDTKYWFYIQLIKEDNEMLQTVRFYEQFFLTYKNKDVFCLKLNIKVN